MKKINFQALLGGGMMILGLLLLLEEYRILPFRAGEFFWGAVLLTGSALFFGMLQRDLKTNWWALIPALTLLGMALGAFLPAPLEDWGGVAFLGLLALAFWGIYLLDRMRWWAIIPGGVLLTLAAISAVEAVWTDRQSGSLLFLGMSGTFLLTALLPNNETANTRWAYYPALALAGVGLFIGMSEANGLGVYLWPAALIVIGLGLVGSFFLRRD